MDETICSMLRLLMRREVILDWKGMGEDLFWAIRGGGGSFGVILSYKIKLVQVPPAVTVFKVSRTLEENATDLVYRWQYFANKVDNDLFLRARIQASIYSKIKGQRTIESSFIAMFLGDSNRLLSIMKDKFPELGLTKQDCKEMSWIKSVLFWAEFPEGTPETALLGRIKTMVDPDNFFRNEQSIPPLKKN